MKTKTDIRAILRTLFMAAAILLAAAPAAEAQRRITPVRPAGPGQTPAAADPPGVIDRTHLVTTVDAEGRTVTVDTVTGKEFVDSTLLGKVPPMEYPLLYRATAGVNVWDPLMRVFGQKYGLAEVWGELNMHNRYFPYLAFGLGDCDDTPANSNYTFRTSLSPFAKIGAAYNFLYNSNPDYQLFAGFHYGLAFQKWSVTGVTVDEGYWQEPSRYSLDGLSATTGYLELCFGIRVRIAGGFSAGWNIIYHSILHESRSAHGQPMYIPGYGKRKSPITGSFSFSYTFTLNKRPEPGVLIDEGALQPHMPASANQD